MREPVPDCRLCPRLSAFRDQNRQQYPDFFNAPVPCFGDAAGRLLVVGLAPGLRGANRTGRPFTGDYAGHLLFATLAAFGFTQGTYDQRPDDGLTLHDCRIANAVRCLPPENKPTPDEVNRCRPFLLAEIQAMPNLRAAVALGSVAHASVIAAFGARQAAYKFAHGVRHDLTLPSGRPLALFDSYHCSRYNTNTGRLTEAMFQSVFDQVRDLLAQLETAGA